MGKLEKIWLKRAKLAPMDEVKQAEIIANIGLVGNVEQKIIRQITIIEKEIWLDIMEKLQGQLPPKTRRANLMVSGIKLAYSRGKILQIGDCEIEIFGELKPCERMEKALIGLESAMYGEWKGGAFGKALNSGVINENDKVYLKSKPNSELKC